MGAGGLRVSSCAGGNVACRRLKKIWALRTFTSRYSSTTRRRAVLDDPARGAAARKYHLYRIGDNCSEAARLDARLLERDAHGLHFPRNRERWHTWCDR